MSHHHESYGLHVGLKIAKIALKAASVMAAVCIAKEIHKVHKAIEKKNELKEEKHHHKLL